MSKKLPPRLVGMVLTKLQSLIFEFLFSPFYEPKKPKRAFFLSFQAGMAIKGQKCKNQKGLCKFVAKNLYANFLGQMNNFPQRSYTILVKKFFF